MDETVVLEQIKKIPVFTLNDFRKIVKTSYAKQALSRLVKKKKVYRVGRSKYTLHRDPFLVAPWMFRSTFISGYSALSHYGLISQLPQDIFCTTGCLPAKKVIFGTEVIYKHSKYIFGYKMEKYLGVDIPIATPERSLIDCIRVIPLHIALENIDEFDKDNLWKTAKKMPIHVRRRIAYIIYKQWGIKRQVKTGRRILLDPLAKNKGKYCKEFNIIDNVWG